MKFHHTNRYFRLELLKKAQQYHQVCFVAQPNCQQMLNRVWYGELSYWRCQPTVIKFIFGFFLGSLWPCWCVAYLIFPNTALGSLLNIPIVQFVCSTASYVTFLGLLSLTTMYPVEDIMGPPFSFLDFLIVLWLLGMLWHDAKNIYYHGLRQFIARQGNVLAIFLQVSFMLSFALKVYSRMYYSDSSMPRQTWPAKHPTLLAEALFAIATVLAFLKLCTFYIVNHTIGPVQISFTFSIGECIVRL